MGEPEVTKAAPTYHVDEGGIVTVGFRAPRTKREFHILKTKEAGDFAAHGVVRIQF